MIKLNLGSGSNYRDGYVNIDKYAAANPDIVWDLEVFPWPIEDSSADEILLRHVLEHLGGTSEIFLNIIKELYRVSANNATIIIEVPHPLHTDFLGDPTHCRPIIPETLQLFDLEYAEQLIRNQNIGTPLAKYINVDFKITEVTTYFDDDNVTPRVYCIKLLVRKRKKITIGNKAFALGDLCMTLGAAHAFKNADFDVTFVAQDRFSELVNACPHVDTLITDVDTPHADYAFAWYNLQRDHQTDAIIKAAEPLGLHDVPNSAKSIDIIIPEDINSKIKEKYPGTNRVALHAVESLGESKTWPPEYWHSLATKLMADGIEVVLIGRRDWYGNDSTLYIPGALIETDLSFLETIALLNQCRVMVAGDTGPIQLAGASECGIVGLYSVASPESKLPYRHGELGWNAIGVETTCEFKNCSKEMVYNDYFNHWTEECINFVQRDGGDLTDMITNWCLNKQEPLSCMRKISVDSVYSAVLKLYREKKIKICDVGPGIGDVCMSLCAAHALHDEGYEVTFVTPVDFHDLVKACPHVHEVTDVRSTDETWLSPAWYQLQDRHQVDTLIQACGLNPSIIPAESKSLDINIPEEISNAFFWNFYGNNRIAIHAGISKDKSRTWPQEYWQELVDRLTSMGIEVVALGKKNWYGRNTVYELKGVHECYDLSALHTIQLLKQCRVLISADAGPIQLAAATNCGIVGLYSVMPSEYRLPYRNGKLGWKAVGVETSCPQKYCFKHMVTDKDFRWSDKAQEQFNSGVSIGDTIANWCENTDWPFSCMEMIEVDTVLTEALRLYKDISLAITGPGIGDVCMGLATAHSLHSLDYRVSLEIQPQFHELALACPYVYSVTNERNDSHVWLSAAWYHFQKGNQVDTLRIACGEQAADDSAKSIVINVPSEITKEVQEKYPGNNRIVIHPAGRDKGKKWPTEYWQQLVNKLLSDGFEVIAIGMDDWLGDSTHRLTGVINEFNKSPLHTIALLNQCAVMISACSGPIQLAGATECGIIGLYSLMTPESRLPYRHGIQGWNSIGLMSDCEYAPCFEKMVTNQPFLWSDEAVSTMASKNQTLGEMMATWCLNEKAPYSCMPGISVDTVYNSVITLYRKQTIR